MANTVPGIASSSAAVASSFVRLHHAMLPAPTNTTEGRGVTSARGVAWSRGAWLSRHVVDKAPASSTAAARRAKERSEEHTAELQAPCKLVCRLLLEKKKMIPR